MRTDPVCDRKHFGTMAEAFLREHPMAIFCAGKWVAEGAGEGETEGKGVRERGAAKRGGVPQFLR